MCLREITADEREGEDEKGWRGRGCEKERGREREGGKGRVCECVISACACVGVSLAVYCQYTKCMTVILPGDAQSHPTRACRAEEDCVWEGVNVGVCVYVSE